MSPGAIVAIGGAEFAMRPENEALHDYVLAQAELRRQSAGEALRICLLPTAAGDPHDQIVAFGTAMERRGCRASAISLFRLGDAPLDLGEHLLAQDVIYVTGGSMVNLLALWRAHGIDEIMGEAHRRGIVLCGYSAGSMCWFEHGISRGSGAPAGVAGLGFLAGSHCVHYSQDPSRRDCFRRLIAAGEIPPGLALDDHAAALFREGKLIEAIRTREPAGACRVVPTRGLPVREEALPARLLPAARALPEPAVEEMRALRNFRAGRRAQPGRVGRPR